MQTTHPVLMNAITVSGWKKKHHLFIVEISFCGKKQKTCVSISLLPLLQKPYYVAFRLDFG
jgi:hypothetical protein